MTGARPGPRSVAGSAVATGRGDDGTTGLLFGGARIRKDDLRTEAYGTIDEAVAALGMARAHLASEPDASGAKAGPAGGEPALHEVVLRIQRELFVAGAELATNPDARDRLVDGTTRVSEEMVAGVESLLLAHEAAIQMPREFVVPGETPASAALELARTILRRAERRVVTLDAAGELAGTHLVRYLNRLADLVWVLARAAEQASSRMATPSRPGRPAGVARSPAKK